MRLATVSGSPIHVSLQQSWPHSTGGGIQHSNYIWTILVVFNHCMESPLLQHLHQ